jgi:hypothetical protein
MTACADGSEEALALANELRRHARGYRGWARDVAMGDLVCLACDLLLGRGLMYRRVLELHRASGFAIHRVHDLVSDPDLVDKLIRGRGASETQDDRAGICELARGIADDLETVAADLQLQYEDPDVPGSPAAVETCTLATLALLLPAAGRSRFVAEARGNLGTCDRWWQRVDHLVCLALGMLRLAWMMWRDGQRGRL